MQFRRLKPLVLILPLLLAACGGGGSALATAGPVPVPLTPQQQLAALEVNGALPILDRSPSLAGPDANANGVRDDVDAYIAENYTVPVVRAAVQQMAGTLQSKLLVDLTDSAAVHALSVRSMAAVNCVFDRFEETNSPSSPEMAIKDIQSITMNTKQRLLKYLAFSKSLDGTTMALPKGNTCE